MDRYWFLTWTTYGTWLPGDERGSVTSVRGGPCPRNEHDQYGTPYEPPMPALREAAEEALKGFRSTSTGPRPRPYWHSSRRLH